MKKNATIYVTFLLLMLPAACSREPALPDLTSIPWIQQYGYGNDELFPVISGKTVPGPQIRVTAGNERQFLLIDVNTIDLFIKENAFPDADFEPQRMSNRLIENNELMVEEGYLHNVKLLNADFPILYVAMIKQSSRSFHPKGIVGRNFLVGNQMTIDMRNNLIAFSGEPSVPLTDLAADSSLIPFSTKNLNSEHDGLLKFHCRINGRPTLATLSTRNYTTRISGDLAQVITGKSTPAGVTLDSLQIGNRTIYGLKCAVSHDLITLEPENDESIGIIIGMDVIGQHLWTIDFINSQILVE